MRRILSLILLIAVIYVLSNTNPSRTEYIDWINHKKMDQSSNILQKGILSVAGKPIFDAGTTQKDYFVFSIYKTDFSDAGMGKLTTVGVFNRFFTVAEEK